MIHGLQSRDHQQSNLIFGLLGRMVPLLKSLCGVRAVVLLSSHPDVKDIIFNTTFWYINVVQKRKELEADLQIKFSNIFNSYPPNLVNFLPLELTPFIWKEMVQYAKLLESRFGLTKEFIRNFIKCSIFSSNGTIDEELAARELLKEQNLSTSVSFKVACYYCLEDVILTMWEKQPILKETFNERDLNYSEYVWLQYLEGKEKYSKSDFNVSKSNVKNQRFLFDLLASTFEDNNFATFKYVWKMVEESEEFKNFGKFKEHKCIAVFNKFYEDWSLNLYYKITNELFSITPSQFYYQFYVYGNLLKFIFSQMTIEEIKNFPSYFKAHYYIPHCILFIFLNWPYQDLFMDTAESLFCTLSENEHYGLMHNILDLISYNYYDIPYNYRLLLREFWIKSPPHLKIHVITLEQVRIQTFSLPPPNWTFVCNTKTLLQKLIFLCNFTPDDEYNFLMILEAATQQDKNNIFKFQGKRICDRLISKGDFKLTDFFLQSLNVDDETQQSFKKDLIINNFPEVMELPSLNLITQLIKWAVGSGEEKTIKWEIFSEWFEFNKAADLWMKSEIDISFLDEIFKLFLNKDEFAEWKQNGVFDVEFAESLVSIYYKPDRFDQFLKWICNTEEKICETKENLLLIILEKGYSFYMSNADLKSMIFYMCSNNREKISKFIIMLLSICETYAEKNVCGLCESSKNMFFDRYRLLFLCIFHCKGNTTFETFDQIRSYFSKELDSLDSKCKKEVENSEKLTQ